MNSHSRFFEEAQIEPMLSEAEAARRQDAQSAKWPETAPLTLPGLANRVSHPAWLKPP